MARHVFNRGTREDAVKDAGDRPSLGPLTREYESSREAVPRTLPALTVPRTVHHLYSRPQYSRSSETAPQDSDDDDTNCDYTFQMPGCNSSSHTPVRLAHAMHILTLDDAQGKLANEQHLTEPATKQANSTEERARRDLSQFPSTTQRQHLENNEHVKIPSPRSELGIRGLVNVEKPGTAAKPASKNSSDDEVKDSKPGLPPASLDVTTTEESEVKGEFLDDGTLTDTVYRESCYLGLGTWPSADLETRADTLGSFIGEPHSADIDPSSLLHSGAQQGFVQAPVRNGSFSGSRRQPNISSSSSSNTFGNNQGQSSGSKKGKRSAGAGGAGGDEDEDEDEDGNSGNKKRFVKRFACPFFKRNPDYYSCNGPTGQYRTCMGPGFTDITRLKEHLRRRHADPITCIRCGMTFEYQNGLDFHNLQAKRCKELLRGPAMGISPHMMVEVMKRSSGFDSEKRWSNIYQLLFPDDTVPSSPFHECNNYDKREFNDYVERQMRYLLDQNASSILDQMQPEQRSELVAIIIRCQKILWDSCGTTHDTEKQVISDGSDTDGHLPQIPESPWTPQEMQSPQASRFNPHPNHPVKNNFYAPQDPTTPMSPQQPATPQELTMQDTLNGRPPPPERGPSRWSDSGYGTLCSCYQNMDGRCDQCLHAAKLSTLDQSRVLQAGIGSYSLPTTIDPKLLHKQPFSDPSANISGPGPGPGTMLANLREEVDVQYQNYNGCHTSFQDGPC
ncbi:hypothetical protein BKA65DRAFT_558140 [Rhexocercosporidium sp. MPI-PUGE-AT-0058]|nr:hypothetical protein BKA65DRAFT_558140 [Rhexocercosporidium sp. MPI-PUGE-AT-0058]